MAKRPNFRKRKRVRGHHRVPVPLPERKPRSDPSSTTPPPETHSTSPIIPGSTNAPEVCPQVKPSCTKNGKITTKCTTTKHSKKQKDCLKGTKAAAAAITSTINVLQFKIALLDVKPSIWRRLLIPYEYNFLDLHLAIQSAMGWTDSGTHQYRLKEINTGISVLISSDLKGENIWGPGEVIADDIDFALHEYFQSVNATALYSYTTEDTWDLKLVFEGMVPTDENTTYPVCIGGKRSSPIEGAERLWVYKLVLQALRSPKLFKDYNETFEKLVKGNFCFDPNRFNRKTIKFCSCNHHFERHSPLVVKDKEQYDEVKCGSSHSSDDGDPDDVPIRPDQFCVHNPTEIIYQFKITLYGSKPKIWRRLHAPGYYTFYDLHVAIQNVMGWQDVNTHFFEMTDTYGTLHIISVDDDEIVWDMKKVKIAEEYTFIHNYFKSNNIFCTYVYNMRAYWEHHIHFEKITVRDNNVDYPLCLAGKRRCPPEACGGITRYEKYLGIAKDVKHPDHKRVAKQMERLGVSWKTDDFDPLLVNFENPRSKWCYKLLDDGFTGIDYRNPLPIKPDKRKIDRHDQRNSASENILQLRISLSGVRPIVWRRIQISARATFWDLHVAIQDVMGWCHKGIHRFEMINPKTHTQDLIVISIKNQSYYFPRTLLKKPIPEETTKLSTFFCSMNKVAWYEFEYVDLWRFKIIVETTFIVPSKTAVSYPICIDGRRASPIIGSGGNTHFNEIVVILNNPNHHHYKDIMKQIKRLKNGPIDFNAFDPKLVHFNNTHHMWKLICNSIAIDEEAEDKLKLLEIKFAHRFIFQLKIELEDVKPKVWRRIQILGDCGFWDLHVAIQDAVGWRDDHLHQFEITDRKTKCLHSISLTPLSFNCGVVRIPEAEAKLVNYFFDKDNIIHYEYDFAAKWDHVITVEKILPTTPGVQYPLCIDGEGTCPMENCGGVLEYLHLVEVMNTPTHPNYQVTMKWIEHLLNGKPYSPIFEPSMVTFTDPKERWKQRCDQKFE